MGQKEISLTDLDKFRINVVKSFEQNRISSIFLFSENYALDMVRNYSDCFDLVKNGTVLKMMVEPEVLVSKFLAYLSNDVIKAAYSVQVAV